MAVLPTDEADKGLGVVPTPINTTLSTAPAEAAAESAKNIAVAGNIFGEGANRLAAHMQKRADEMETAQTNEAVQAFVRVQDTKDQQEKEKASGFANGFTDSQRSRFEQESEEMISKLPESQQPRVRSMIAAETTRRQGVYIDFEVSKRNKHAENVANDRFSESQKTLYASPSVETLEAEKSRMRAEINALPIPQDQKDDMIKKSESQLVGTRLVGDVAARNELAAKALATRASTVNNGVFETFQRIENASGDPASVSKAGAVGRFQVMPGTAAQYVPELKGLDLRTENGVPVNAADFKKGQDFLLKNPDRADAAGRAEITSLMVRYTKPNGQIDYDAVAIGYNAGPGTGDKFFERAKNGDRDISWLPEETQKYVPKFRNELSGRVVSGQSYLQQNGVIDKRLGRIRGDAENITKETGYEGTYYKWSDFKNDGEHGGEGTIKAGVVRIAENMSAAIGQKMPISSASRSEAYNASQKGAKDSRHMHGDALDLTVAGLTDEQKSKAIATAIASGATGIGIYDNGSIHMDMKPGALRTWYNVGANKKDVAALPEWAKKGIADGQAAAVGKVAPAATGAAPTTPGATTGAAPASAPETGGAPPLQVTPLQNAADPNVRLNTPSGVALATMPQNVEVPKPMPGETYSDFLKRRQLAVDFNATNTTNRIKLENDSFTEVAASNKVTEKRDLDNLMNGLYSGALGVDAIRQAQNAGLLRGREDLQSALNEHVGYANAIESGVKKAKAEHDAAQKLYAEDLSRRGHLGALEPNELELALRDGKITSSQYTSARSAIEGYDKRKKEGIGAFATASKGGLSRFSTEDRKTVNSAYEFMTTTPNKDGKVMPHDMAAGQLLAVNGFLPSSYVERSKENLLSKNPQIVKSQLDALNTMLMAHPNAIRAGGLSADVLDKQLGGDVDLVRTMSVYSHTRQFISEAEAVQRVMQMQDPEFRRQTTERIEKGDLKDKLDTAKKLEPDAIAKGALGLWTTPNVGYTQNEAFTKHSNNAIGQRLKTDWITEYRLSLEMTGNDKVATESANAAIARNYGETRFGDRTFFHPDAVVPYPPEKVLGASSDDIEKQAKQTLKDKGIPDHNRIVLVLRDQSNGRVMIPKDGALPAYSIFTQSKNGALLNTGEVLRYKHLPDPDRNKSPFDKYVDQGK